MSSPATTGNSTILIIDRNRASAETESHWPASPKVIKGVKMGEMRVEVEVIATDSARSPFARYVTIFEAVPPGHDPNNISPTASSGGNLRALARPYANKGITVY